MHRVLCVARPVGCLDPTCALAAALPPVAVSHSILMESSDVGPANNSFMAETNSDGISVECDSKHKIFL